MPPPSFITRFIPLRTLASASSLKSSLAASARGITKNSALDWKLRDHALFIGYAPVKDPKYAIVSIIEHGATVAHPHVANARDVMLFCQQRDPARLPAAYPPVNSAELTTPQKQASAAPSPQKIAKAAD